MWTVYSLLHFSYSVYFLIESLPGLLAGSPNLLQLNGIWCYYTESCECRMLPHTSERWGSAPVAVQVTTARCTLAFSLYTALLKNELIRHTSKRKRRERTGNAMYHCHILKLCQRSWDKRSGHIGVILIWNSGTLCDNCYHLVQGLPAPAPQWQTAPPHLRPPSTYTLMADHNHRASSEVAQHLHLNGRPYYLIRGLPTSAPNNTTSSKVSQHLHISGRPHHHISLTLKS